MKIIFTILFYCLLFSISVFSQKAEVIDEFGTLGCDEYLARMDNVFIQAANNPDSKTYIFIYEGKEPNYNNRRNNSKLDFPTFGSAKARIKSIKEYLKRRKHSDDKFVFVEAGFREEYGVEIWRVPDGATPPEPTLTVKKMKYKKGKARSFCIDCCGL